MKILNKAVFIILLTVLLVPSTAIFGQASISIDHVDGLSGGKVRSNVPVRFHLRLTNNAGTNYSGISSGFRVYLSNNGELANGSFEPIYLYDMLPEFSPMFDYIFFVN